MSPCELPDCRLHAKPRTRSGHTAPRRSPQGSPYRGPRGRWPCRADTCCLGLAAACNRTRERFMIAFDQLFAADLPAPAARWNGHPRYNFIGGNNDPEVLPVEALAASAERVLRREGHKLATYHLGEGPMGHAGLRAFVAGKLGSMRGIEASADDVLITSGSLQGLDLVNEVLLERGDTVIMEQLTYGGMITRLQRRGVRMVGVPLDEHGMRTDLLAHAARGPARPGHPAEVHLHHPDRAEPHRHGAEPRAPARAAAPQQGVRGADLRGRVLCRSAVGGRVAAGAARPARRRAGDPHRLVLQVAGAGTAARLRQRALGRHEPAGRVQGRRRHARDRADGGGRLLRRSTSRTMSAG